MNDGPCTWTDEIELTWTYWEALRKLGFAADDIFVGCLTEGDRRWMVSENKLPDDFKKFIDSDPRGARWMMHVMCILNEIPNGADRGACLIALSQYVRDEVLLERKNTTSYLRRQAAGVMDRLALLKDESEVKAAYALSIVLKDIAGIVERGELEHGPKYSGESEPACPVDPS